jgi:hypothetical protein
MLVGLRRQLEPQRLASESGSVAVYLHALHHGVHWLEDALMTHLGSDRPSLSPSAGWRGMPGYGLVDLIARYSNQADQLKRVSRTLKSWRRDGRSAPCPVRSPRRVELRLTVADIAQLVADYQAGCAGEQLGESYGLARSTVIELLRAQGVMVRRPWVTLEETAQAVQWYQEGVRARRGG